MLKISRVKKDFVCVSHEGHGDQSENFTCDIKHVNLGYSRSSQHFITGVF